MGVIVTAESAYGRELQSWNTPKRRGGHNADGFEQYPLMLYLARRNREGDIEVSYRSVANEGEEKRAMLEGYRDGREAAREALEHRERAVGDEAAARAFRDKGMSDAAKVEAAAAEDTTPEHVPEIPEQPRQKRAYHRRQKPAES